MFEGRKIVIATKHLKEKVIAPFLEKELGAICFVDATFDTDEFGTFAGEVERKDDPLTTIRNKCIRAMELNNCDLGIASEGSFGPHPSIFFIPADDELLIFIDKKNDLEIVVRELSTETNFNGKVILSKDELISFANKVQFPSHALILKQSKDDYSEMVKGITNWDLLFNLYHQFYNKNGLVYVETDMRAMYNPTRMNVIAKATEKLVKKIQSICPACETPGFGVTDIKSGLPCALCNFPTKSTLSFIYVCKKCAFEKEEKYPHGKLKEDAMYCDMCNP